MMVIGKKSEGNHYFIAAFFIATFGLANDDG